MVIPQTGKAKAFLLGGLGGGGGCALMLHLPTEALNANWGSEGLNSPDRKLYFYCTSTMQSFKSYLCMIKP